MLNCIARSRPLVLHNPDFVFITNGNHYEFAPTVLLLNQPFTVFAGFCPDDIRTLRRYFFGLELFAHLRKKPTLGRDRPCDVRSRLVREIVVE